MSDATTLPIKALYEGFAAGDIAAAVAGFHPEIVWNEAENLKYADGNPYVGADAVIAGVFARIGGEFDGFTATPGDWISGEDRVAVLGRYGGRHKTTGKALDAAFVHVFTVANGQITAFEQHTDTAQWRAVAG
ncbi:MAG TPA: nuclear transport factor 2 family protein [Brevundimonas sp.]|nr:nuclear transport factor 2 family protein [Brevundimonas sp.]